MKEYIIIAVGVVLGIALMVFLCKKHVNFVFSLFLRTVFGILCIYLINTVLGELNLVSPIGMNWMTILVAALLGVPGIILLYGAALVFME